VLLRQSKDFRCECKLSLMSAIKFWAVPGLIGHMFSVQSYLKQTQVRRPNFQGHFATPLKNVHFQPGIEPGLLYIAQEVKDIGDQEGFGVGLHCQDAYYHSSQHPHLPRSVKLRESHKYPFPLVKDDNNFFWAQDANLFYNGEILGASGQGLSMFEDWSSCQGQAYKNKGLGQPKKLAKHLGKPYRAIPSYLEGGNLFLGQKPNGDQMLLLGEDSVWMNARRLLKQSHSDVFSKIGFGLKMLWAELTRKPQKLLLKEEARPFYEAALAQIALDLKINPENIVLVPQPDFHIDLAIRPLQYPYVLVHDPKLSETMTEDYAVSTVGQMEMIQGQKVVNNLLNAEDYSPRHPEEYTPQLFASSPSVALAASSFEAEAIAATGKYATCDEICRTLEAAGLKPIRIGGVFPYPEIKDKAKEEPNPWLPANFLNAIVHQRKNLTNSGSGETELVYITNDSGLPHLNALFEAQLKEKAPWVKRVEFVGKSPKANTVSWMSTYLKMSGGIHCLSVEEPET
jgi:hypothetical protein